ncbi:hypothetical protein ADK56_25815 [Streptomyces sp. MMG1522]|nr:hypothetical protein ADK33_10495 [Streptomyces griseus subsp. rhodochrous]KOU47305.1 hypothetical protein ADK56_25815 [Streptomyces sp. MMG1522]
MNILVVADLLGEVRGIHAARENLNDFGCEFLASIPFHENTTISQMIDSDVHSGPTLRGIFPTHGKSCLLQCVTGFSSQFRASTHDIRRGFRWQIEIVLAHVPFLTCCWSVDDRIRRPTPPL